MRTWGTLILCFFLCCLCGCTADRPADPAAVAEAMAQAGGGAAGRMYVFDARDAERGVENVDVMPASLVAAAFSDGGEVFASLEAYGIYLSGFAVPVEYGCLIAARERDAETVAALCLQRMEAIGRLCGAEYTAAPPLVMGRCVFYAVGEGALAALDAAREMMRRG